MKAPAASKTRTRSLTLYAAALTLATVTIGCPSSGDLGVGPAIAPVRIVDDVTPGANDPFTVSDYHLTADTLTLDVEYSGGCETHGFTALVGSSIAESLPVQMWGRIAHDDRGDPCDGIVSGTLEFDLSPIKDLYVRSYGAGSATVILHLAPLGESLRYAF